MKKLSFLMAILPMLFCACSSLNEENNAPIIPATPDLQAGFADDTRTYVENNKYIRWHEDDRLTAFYGNTLNRQYKFNGKTGDNSGTFSLVPSGELGTGNAFDRIYAVYPYNETTTITDEGEISLTIPAVQSYAENSFGKGANTMLAVTENLEDTFLAFKNACGYLKLKLYNADGVTIKSIEIKGNNNEKIAGAATATIAFGEAPQLRMADDATTTVTIDCGEGVTLGTTAETATEFWVVLPETTFTKGLTIKATNTDGGIFEKSTANEVIITRNEILPMAAVDADIFKGIIPNDEIWYTSKDGKIVTPYATKVFGANIVSNTYENGKGIIKFDGAVAKVGDSAFKNCTLLESIELPHSITQIGAYAFNCCTALTGLIIPNSVTSLGGCLLNGCKNLINVVVPSSVVFNSNYNIRDVKIENLILQSNIPDGEDSLSAFFDKTCVINNLIIDKSVDRLGKYAFFQCVLQNITIFEGLEELGTCSFYGTSISKIALPKSLRRIETGVFAECAKLEEIVFEENVQFFENFIYYKDYNTKKNLKSIIYIKAKMPPILDSDSDVDMWGYSYISPLYVPKGSLEVYYKAPGWRKISNIVEYEFE